MCSLIIKDKDGKVTNIVKSCKFTDESDGCIYLSMVNSIWIICYCSTDHCNDKLEDGKTCPIKETTKSPIKETTRNPIKMTTKEPNNNDQVKTVPNTFMLISFLFLNANVYNVFFNN